ncbi:MAG: hypothetical protein R3D98_01485 [Candidatus Krumholzibacteriia bacterium]
MTGSLAMPVVWTLVLAVGLLAWPWLLARLAGRRPQLADRLAGGVLPTGAELTAIWRGGPAVAWPTLVAWAALVLLAGVLPVASGWTVADLDAGALWVLVLALVIWLAVGRRGVSAAAAAGAMLTLTASLVPVVLRVASLNLTDMVVAQQGGAGNWFLVREPLLMLGGLGFLLAAASLAAAGQAPAAADPWSVALRWGTPLVAAHLFAVLFLGGWWAVAPVADGLPWLNTALKTLVGLLVINGLRARRWVTPSLLVGWLPPAALAVSLASLAWLLLGGAVR